MNNVVSLKGCVTFNSNINNRGIFAKCGIGYSNYENDIYERGTIVFLTNNNANNANIDIANDVRMSIDSVGNVGIGTSTSTTEKLIVDGNVKITNGYLLTCNITANAVSALNLSGIGSNIRRIHASNITDGILPFARGGIGTNSLQDGRLLVGASIGTGTSFATQSPYLAWNNAIVAFSTSNILATGNVGIGTTISDLNKLDVNGNINISSGSKFKIGGVNLSYSHLEGVPTTPINNGGDNLTSNFVISTSNNLFTDYVLRDNFTSNFVRSSSNILVTDYVLRDNFTSNFIRGSSNILFSDYVERDNFTSNFIRSSSNILFSDYVARITSLASSSTSVWTISGTNIYNNNSANVGIGTSEPSAYKLQVAGSIGSLGDITASYSDERLKDITEYIDDVLPILNNIKVFRYNCNDVAEKYGYDKNKKELGLSAQEIQKYYPELVCLAPFDSIYDSETQQTISKSGEDYLTLNYERLVPVLLQAIKELNNKYEALEEKYSKLDSNPTAI